MGVVEVWFGLASSGMRAIDRLGEVCPSIPQPEFHIESEEDRPRFIRFFGSPDSSF